MKIRGASSLSLLLCSTLAYAQQPNSLKLIPTPREVELRSGTFTFNRDVSVVLGDPTREDDRFSAEQLAEEAQRELKLKLPVAKNAKEPVFLGLVTDEAIRKECDKRKLTVDDQLGNESYVLDVSPGSIVIAAKGTAGVFYGVQTLKQLIRANRTGSTIPCLRIRDWPGLKYRGYSDDISRGPIPTMDFFKREIRTMAEFKMNMLTFYTEHVFKLKKYPFIAPDDGITAEEVKELSDYAKPYHVELVGNFQSFGHFYNILKHDEFKDLRETMGIITPAKEASYDFLSYIYSEIAPAYNSPFFNVNCDETYGLGEGPSKAEAEKIGVGGVYVKHMVRLHDILKSYGKRMMMWGDIALQHPTIVQQLPKDTILLSWGYGAAEKYDAAIEPFTKAGFEFMVCPGVSCWSQIFPNYENAVVNIRNYIRDGAKFGALGTLNTTWDDDGENLFSWNFYGTNWGAACSWRPEDSTIKDYDAAFSQVSYGTKSAAVAEAIKLLSSTVNIGLTRGLMDPAFWEPPFGALTTTIRATTEQAEKLESVTDEVEKLLTQAKKESTLDAVDLDYLLFANRRLSFLADSRLARVTAAQECSKAFEAYLGGVGNDTSEGRKAMQRALDSFTKLSSELSGMRSEYERLWRLENRPSSLDNILKRYNNLLKQFSDEEQLLRKAIEDLDKTGTLPDPRSIGLEVVETTARNTKALPSRTLILPANAPWWNDAWSYRLPIRVDIGDIPRVDCPVELHVNLSGLPKPLDPQSMRLVECKPTGEIVGEIPYQFDPDKEGTAGNVVFMLSGMTPAKTPRFFALYFGADVTQAVSLSNLGAVKTTEAKEGVWIENDRYKILLGKEGAHLYIWQVKSLDNKDVTEPGEKDWAGFSDYGTNDRTAEFELTQEAKGPVMVRYRCKSKLTGKEKVFSFFAGASWVEVMLDPPVSFYWDYDRIDNFAADSPTPGTAIFSNGHTEPVCKSTEQTHAVGNGTTWCAKTRADGFLLANLTPEVATTHMTGPGGGWGGVGVEWGAPAAHFITFADKTDQKPADLLNALQRTVDFRNQARMYVGKVETRQ